MATILVVDDQPSNRELLVYLLVQNGHQLLEAADGAEALAITRATQPDLVIIDLVMPIMDGYEFVHQLRADPLVAQTRVIFYTAIYLQSEAWTLAQAYGVQHVITKPAEPELVLKIVAEVLALSLSSFPSLSFDDFHREHLRVLTNKLFKQVQALEQEVRERQRAEEKYRYLAYYDPVTGLPNRLHFEDLLTQAIEHAVADGSRFAVFFFSLEAMQDTISRFGYEMGDRLLKSVSQRLQDRARPLSIAHLGSNLFAVLATPVSGEVEAAELARHLQQAVATLMDTADYQEIFLTTHLGGVLFPRDGETGPTLLQHATSALSQAKSAGKNGLCFFDHQSLEQLHARVSLTTQLRRALDRQEFVLHYQPKIQLPTFRVTGVEALLRWQKPGQGLVAPGVFIALAEDTRLILPLSEWCLREACRQWGRWRQLELPPLRLAVNMSPRQFEDPALIERYAAILSETGMDPTCLDLEVTESVLLQGIEPIQRTLRTLREWGCSFSLDDFGTGYSSLSYLKTLPLSILKIDQVFVHQLAVNKQDAAITALIIEMAHTLGLTVVAEGVETVTQVSILNRYGCDELQGYYITRPLEADSLTRFLQSDTLSLLKSEAEASWGHETKLHPHGTSGVSS